MSLVVMKFGGTSVAVPNGFARRRPSVQQHAERADDVVVVVSALSKVTDLILGVLNSARLGKGKDMEEGCSCCGSAMSRFSPNCVHGKTGNLSRRGPGTLERLHEFCSALLLLARQPRRSWTWCCPWANRCRLTSLSLA